MNFSNDKAIYIQMADRLCDDILSGKNPACASMPCCCR